MEKSSTIPVQRSPTVRTFGLMTTYLPDWTNKESTTNSILAPQSASALSSTKKTAGRPKSAVAYIGLKSVIAGTLTGMIEMCINFPTDYIKTQLQLDSRSVNPRYKGIFGVVKHTIRNHGIRGIYQGLNIAILNPKTPVRFASFEQLKKRCADSSGALSPAARFLCGFGAGVCEGVFAVTPIESIKVKFIHDQNQASRHYNGLFHGIRQIIREQGIRGLYQGAVPTVIKTSSNQAVRFFVVESLKDWKRKGDPTVSVSKPLTAVFGAIGGVISVFLNTPVDIVKSRMQGLEAHKYRNTLYCAHRIFVKEGAVAFYKGVTPRLVRVPIEVAISFSVYDTIMELFTAAGT